jgi:hypothetical protein
MTDICTSNEPLYPLRRQKERKRGRDTKTAKRRTIAVAERINVRAPTIRFLSPSLSAFALLMFFTVENMVGPDSRDEVLCLQTLHTVCGM